MNEVTNAMVEAGVKVDATVSIENYANSDIVATKTAVNITCMDFGDAVRALKEGKKVARKGWNGKGMFLYFVPAGNYSPCTEVAKQLVNEDGLVPYAPYIAMKTAQGYVVPWLASQTDILSNDWEIV